MLLPDHEIAAAVEAGRIGIDPWDPRLVQPASLDIRVGEEFTARVYEPAPDENSVGRWVTRVHHGPFDLRPGKFALAHTLETVTLPADLAGRVEGKSSLGRLGLIIHTTAGWIDPGFTGEITLELRNVAEETIPLVPGQRIGQLNFMRLTSPAKRPYGSPGLGSHYQGQRGVTPSWLAVPDPSRRIMFDDSMALIEARYGDAIDELGRS
jgi:dCTP deaminase